MLCRPNVVISTDRLSDGLWGPVPPRTAGKSLQIQVHHLRRALGDDKRIIYRAPGYPHPRPSSVTSREPAARRAGPAQLPATIKDFTGRSRESAALARFLTGADAPRTAGEPARHIAALAVATVCGRAGVGKTALAVEVAHRVCDEFPDGQLYMNLRGTEPEPVDPSWALARFIRALGVAGKAVPERLDERAELYRDLTADRHMLVVLDNARDERQVRPLLPGTSRCAVLVTSRARLSGLEGALMIDLDEFEPAAAVTLLAQVAGSERVAAESVAAERIVSLCGYLPLAVRVAAARLAARPHWSLATFADRLSDEHRVLDELAVGDLEVRGSVALSYGLLGDEQRRLLRLLGHLPDLDFPGWVAMPLADAPQDLGERLLDALTEARLVEAVRRDGSGDVRYRLHDLLRVFARERSAIEDRTKEVIDAFDRLYEVWLHLATQADNRFEIAQHLVRTEWEDESPRWTPDTATVDHATRDPLDWMEQERALLVASVLHTRDLGLHHITWKLTACLARFLQNRWYSDDWRVTHHAALEAARSAGDDQGGASTLRAIGHMHIDRDRYDEALHYFRQALDGFRLLGDQKSRAHVLQGMAGAHRGLGQFRPALDCLAEARSIFAADDDKPGLAAVLYVLSGIYRESGRYEDALPAYHQALDLFRQLRDSYNEARLTTGLGMVLYRLGRIDDAKRQIDESLALSRKIEHWGGEMFARIALGELLTGTGDWPAAAAELATALSIAEEHNDLLGRAVSLHYLGNLYRRQDRDPEARKYLLQAHQIFRSIGSPYATEIARMLE